MNNSNYVFSNSRTLRTTLECVQYFNITLPASLNTKGAIAVIHCEELVGQNWREGRKLFGLVTEIGSSDQISHILNRGRDLAHLNAEISGIF